MKAIVWTDVFQSVVMIAGLLAIVIQVCRHFVLFGFGIWEFNHYLRRKSFLIKSCIPVEFKINCLPIFDIFIYESEYVGIIYLLNRIIFTF